MNEVSLVKAVRRRMRGHGHNLVGSNSKRQVAMPH
jgi:hypothetical protein